MPAPPFQISSASQNIRMLSRLRLIPLLSISPILKQSLKSQILKSVFFSVSSVNNVCLRALSQYFASPCAMNICSLRNMRQVTSLCVFSCKLDGGLDNTQNIMITWYSLQQTVCYAYLVRETQLWCTPRAPNHEFVTK